MNTTSLATERPVVLADGGSVGTLGLARSVGREGIPVHLVTDRATSPAARSSYVSAVHRVDEQRLRGPGLVDALGTVGKSLERRGVFLTASDSHLRIVSPRRDRVAEHMDLDFAEHDLVESCMDKGTFGELGHRLELRVPGSVLPRSDEHLRGRLPSLDFPVFVKPRHRSGWSGLPAGVVESFKGVRRNDPEQVMGLYRKLREHGAHDVVVQEFVTGPDSGHVSVHLYRTPAGRLAGLFSARKVRVWPAHAGVGCMIVSESVPRAEALARTTVERMGLTGFASVQMKHDSLRDRFVVHEINVSRYSTWVELSAVAGCNLPLVAYAEMTGQDPPPVRTREGIAWVDWRRDRKAFRVYREHGEWTWPDYLWSLRRVRCGAYFAWDDLRPFLLRAVDRAAEAVTSRLVGDGEA